MDENFNKFKKKIMIEHLIKSIIYSVSLGLGFTSVLFVIFKRIPLILNFFVYLIIGAVISLIAFYLLYNAYKPKDEEIAKRLDKQFSLHENVETMVKFKNEDNAVVNVQRKMTSSKLERIPSKSLPMKFAVTMFVGVFVSLGMCVGSFFIPEKKVNADIVDSSSSSSENNSNTSYDNQSSSSSTSQESISDRIDKIIEEVNSSSLDDKTKDEIIDKLENLKDELPSSEDKNQTIDNTKKEIDEIIDKLNSKNIIGEKLSLSENENVKLLGEGIKNIDKDKIKLALDNIKNEIKDNLSKKELYYNEIDTALKTSLLEGVSEDDELYQALNKFINSLINADIELLDNIFSTAYEDILKALEKQQSNEAIKNKIDEELDALKPDDSDSSDDGEKGDQKDDSKDDPNGDKKDDSSVDGDQKDDDKGQGGKEDGKTQYGSDDKVYSKDGTSTEYGDVLDDYYGDIVNGENDGESPDDIGDIIDDYFSTLYGNGGK